MWNSLVEKKALIFFLNYSSSSRPETGTKNGREDTECNTWSQCDNLCWRKAFFLNKITPVDLDQKQEPKTEDKTQNATHKTNVKIAGGKKLFFKNKITPVDLDQKQEPKTEDKTQTATHEANVKIAGGKKHFFQNKITPVDLDQKLDYWNQKLKTRQRLQHMKPIWKSLVEKTFLWKIKLLEYI